MAAKRISLAEWEQLARQCNYRVQDLAAYFNIHPRTLLRRCLRQLGTTPKDWLDDLRLCRALALLDGGLRPRDVSEMLGFPDQTHFSRAFRRRFGLSPREYRGQHSPLA